MSQVNTKPGFNRHARRIEKEKKSRHTKKIHRIGKREDDFDPTDMIKEFNSTSGMIAAFLHDDKK